MSISWRLVQLCWAILCGFGIGYGAYHNSTVAAVSLVAWSLSELITFLFLRKSAFLEAPSKETRSSIAALARIAGIYGKNTAVSERVIESTILQLRDKSNLTEVETRFLLRLRDLLELKSLVLETSPEESLEFDLREGFAYSALVTPVQRFELPHDEDMTADGLLEEIRKNAHRVANLYWRTLDTALTPWGELSAHSKDLISVMMGEKFDEARAKTWVKEVTDLLLKEEGVPALILNLLRRKAFLSARKVAQLMFSVDEGLSEDTRNSMYWVSELVWFKETLDDEIIDFDSTLRYLYHLCFISPERAPFLEVDSHYFAQLEMVNEIAQEGFLFKESLVDRILALWADTEPFFGEVFQPLMERLLARKSKIYDDRAAWEMIWRREKDHFNREYLYVVEGNLLYADNEFRDAIRCYEKALALHPDLKSAKMNLLCAYAEVGMVEAHSQLAHKVRSERKLPNETLVTLANSYLLLGDEAKSESCYNELASRPGWENKADYYRSMFFYDRSRFERALVFAERAAELNPNDIAVRFHLSLCYKAVSDFENAITSVAKIKDRPDWMRFFQFGLEKDAGRFDDAAATLLSIPTDYYEDEAEKDEALRFAKSQSHFILLKHLRN